MLEPQSAALFVLLIAMFGVLVWRTLAARRIAVRVLAACLAFVPAMTFGVLAVNKYYGYYQTWGSMVADLTHQDAGAASAVPEVDFTRSQAGTLDGSHAHLTLAERQGYLVRLMVTGHRRWRRAVWAVGAALLGIVVAKLFLVELADRGSLYRIVSFIVVGGLMLAVGYFAPMPPARDDEPAHDRPLGDPA